MFSLDHILKYTLLLFLLTPNIWGSETHPFTAPKKKMERKSTYIYGALGIGAGLAAGYYFLANLVKSASHEPTPEQDGSNLNDGREFLNHREERDQNFHVKNQESVCDKDGLYPMGKTQVVSISSSLVEDHCKPLQTLNDLGKTSRFFDTECVTASKEIDENDLNTDRLAKTNYKLTKFLKTYFPLYQALNSHDPSSIDYKISKGSKLSTSLMQQFMSWILDGVYSQQVENYIKSKDYDPRASDEFHFIIGEPIELEKKFQKDNVLALSSKHKGIKKWLECLDGHGNSNVKLFIPIAYSHAQHWVLLTVSQVDGRNIFEVEDSKEKNVLRNWLNKEDRRILRSYLSVLFENKDKDSDLSEVAFIYHNSQSWLDNHSCGFHVIALILQKTGIVRTNLSNNTMSVDVFSDQSKVLSMFHDHSLEEAFDAFTPSDPLLRFKQIKKNKTKDSFISPHESEWENDSF